MATFQSDVSRHNGQQVDLRVTATVSRSEIDGRPIVQIDTETDVGAMRVYINDGTIYDGDPEGA